MLTPLPTLLALAIAAHAPAASADSLPSWVARDSAKKTVTLALDVSPGAPGKSATLSGHRDGDVTLVVPYGWTLQWKWANHDSTAHSLVVMPEREKVPMEGGRPAFDNAYTREPLRGLPPGATDRSGFVLDQGGWYWVLCGVPGHAAAGEWLELHVDDKATDVGVKARS